MLRKMALTLALVWAVCLAAMCAALAEADDPVVVRVGDFSFTKSQLQSAIDTDVTLTETLEQTYMTDEERQARREATIDRFIGIGLIQCKLQDAGRNDFTPEEEEDLKAAARNQYEQLWQGLWQRAQDSGEDFTEEQVTEFIRDEGYTAEAIYEEFKASERRYRAIELYCPGITLTQDMIREYYQTQFLDPDRERYENDLDLYEQEILAQKNESFYTPDGYRAIKQILLAYPDEVDRGLKNERARVNLAARAVSRALQDVANAGITAEGWDDMVKPRAAYDAAAGELRAAQQAYAEKRERLTLPLIGEKTKEIRAAFDAGIDFDSLVGKYSADKNEQNTTGGGYPVHPDSKNWPEDFLRAVAALQKPGDISDPVLTDMGIHILYYASDIPGGEHELTPEERETLNASAINYYQNQELERLIDGWRDEYDSETHPELLDD